MFHLIRLASNKYKCLLFICHLYILVNVSTAHTANYQPIFEPSDWPHCNQRDKEERNLILAYDQLKKISQDNEDTSALLEWSANQSKLGADNQDSQQQKLNRGLIDFIVQKEDELNTIVQFYQTFTNSGACQCSDEQFEKDLVTAFDGSFKVFTQDNLSKWTTIATGVSLLSIPFGFGHAISKSELSEPKKKLAIDIMVAEVKKVVTKKVGKDNITLQEKLKNDPIISPPYLYFLLCKGLFFLKERF